MPKPSEILARGWLLRVLTAYPEKECQELSSLLMAQSDETPIALITEQILDLTENFTETETAALLTIVRYLIDEPREQLDLDS